VVIGKALSYSPERHRLHRDNQILQRSEQFEEVKAKIDDWMNYYNNDRYQWQLAKLSPNEHYEYVTTGKYPLPVWEPRAAK